MTIGRKLSLPEALEELKKMPAPPGMLDIVGYRREKFSELCLYTSRPAIVYAVDFADANKIRNAPLAVTQVNQNDLRGLHEATKNLNTDSVDIIIHSGGGSSEAAESIVNHLHSKFKTIRAFVPRAAKGAAAMLTLGANEIWMTPDAELGSIDPHFILNDGKGGQIATPAQAIIAQVERARKAIRDDANDANLWAVLAQALPTGLYHMALGEIALARTLAEQWLTEHMFKGESEATQKATRIAALLSSQDLMSCKRRFTVNELVEHGALAKNTEAVDPQLDRHLTSLWTSIELSFLTTPAIKILENNEGFGETTVALPVPTATLEQFQQIQGNLG